LIYLYISLTTDMTGRSFHSTEDEVVKQELVHHHHIMN
jgi:hypothetical protein